MRDVFRRFIGDESGATAVEYGLIATLIGVALIAGATNLGTQLGTTFGFIKNKIGQPAAPVR